MNQLGTFERLPIEEPFPGLRRRTFDGSGATVNEYCFEPGASFPLHRHPQEQITLVVDGTVELLVEGDTFALEAGAWSVVDANVEHGIVAGQGGARILAIIVPRREAADAYTVVDPL